jgi:oligoendopeptidase F
VSQDFQAGDFLIFQIESAYGLLRILAVEETLNGTVWHLAAYNEMFLDIEMADAALENSSSLTISRPHLAVTNRAFESTQVARMKNEPLNEVELTAYREWIENPDGKVSDVSVRLLLGLR